MFRLSLLLTLATSLLAQTAGAKPTIEGLYKVDKNACVNTYVIDNIMRHNADEEIEAMFYFEPGALNIDVKTSKTVGGFIRLEQRMIGDKREECGSGSPISDICYRQETGSVDSDLTTFRYKHELAWDLVPAIGRGFFTRRFDTQTFDVTATDERVILDEIRVENQISEVKDPVAASFWSPESIKAQLEPQVWKVHTHCEFIRQ